jgi:hypothetical protein
MTAMRQCRIFADADEFAEADVIPQALTQTPENAALPDWFAVHRTGMV